MAPEDGRVVRVDVALCTQAADRDPWWRRDEGEVLLHDDCEGNPDPAEAGTLDVWEGRWLFGCRKDVVLERWVRRSNGLIAPRMPSERELALLFRFIHLALHHREAK